LFCCSLNSKYYYSVGACICQPEILKLMR